MAQEAVNTVIQALQRGMEQVQALRNAQQQYQEFEESKKLQIEAAQKMYDLRNAELDLQRSQLKHAQAHQDFTDAVTSQATNIPIPGFQAIPGITPAQQPATVPQIQPINVKSGIFANQPAPEQLPQPTLKPLTLTDLQSTQQISPTGEQYTIPPYSQRPDILLAQQTAREAEAAKIREEQARQIAETQRFLTTQRALQAEQGARQLLTMAKEHDYRLSENAATLQGQKELEGMRAASALAVAKIRTGTDLSDFASMPGATDILNGIKMGTVSQEDVNRNTFKKQINAFALDQGYQILPKAKTDKIAAIEQMTNLLPTARDMLNLQFMHPIEVNNPFSAVGQDFDAKSKIVRAAAPQASVAVSGVRRFTQEELGRFDQYFMPKKTLGVSSPQANLEKYNSFVNDLRTSVSQLVKGLSSAQAEAIISNLKGKGAAYLQGVQSQQPGIKGVNVYRQNPKTGVLELVPEGQ